MNSIVGNGTLVLTWTPVSQCGVVGYNVYRKKPGDTDFTKLTTPAPLPKAASSYTDTTGVTDFCLGHEYDVSAVYLNGTEVMSVDGVAFEETTFGLYS